MLAPLYIHRPLVQSDDFYSWLQELGFVDLYPQEKLHTTQAYSRNPVFHPVIGLDPCLLVLTDPTFVVQNFGGCTVLVFACDWMVERCVQLTQQGCSWDFPEFNPHIAISETWQPDVRLPGAFSGSLTFGLEVKELLNEQWSVQ